MLIFTNKLIIKNISMEENNPKQKVNSKTNFLLGFFAGMAILSVVAFFILLVVVFSNRQEVDLAAKAAEVNDQPQEEMQLNPVEPIKDGEYVYGNKNANIQIIEYTDFECPFCSRHYETMKQIEEEYKDDVAIVVRHFPLSFHPEAQKAAEAVECAGEQGKFWEMYTVAFEANLAGNMGVDTWKAGAKKMGLNTSKFNSCLDDGKYAQKVADDQASGADAGVTGTPATFINGELISGALPVENFEQIIDSLL